MGAHSLIWSNNRPPSWCGHAAEIRKDILGLQADGFFKDVTPPALAIRHVSSRSLQPTVESQKAGRDHHRDKMDLVKP
jgi:hypothetical protein